MATQRSTRAEAPRITPAETQALLSQGKALAVDVRPLDDYANGHIPGAIWAPLNRLRSVIQHLPRDKAIVFY